MNPEECLRFLQEASFGILALSDGDQPYAVPLNHYYENNRLYFHAAHQGRKLEIIRSNPKVCYTVAEMQAVKPSDNGLLCSFGAYYRSLICSGTASLIEDAAEKAAIVSKLTRHIAPDLSANMHDVSPEQTAAIHIIAVDIESISGKANRSQA